MAITKEQYEAGMSYDAWKAGMTRNQEQLATTEKAITISDAEIAAIAALPKPVKVLAIGEDWCGDVIANLPILAKVAEKTGKLDVKVLLRDTEPGKTVMQSYLNKGEFLSIPVFVFVDDDFNELGNFKERPDSVTEMRAKQREDLAAAHPEWGDISRPMPELPEEVRTALGAELAKLRAETLPFANSEVVREIVAAAKA
jgi:thiol-disulfide isomerase/thioredoxin